MGAREFTSAVERIAATRLRRCLGATPVFGELSCNDDFNWCLAALDRFIPQLLSEIDNRWLAESLDGIYCEKATKLDDRSAELVGSCVLISDQTLAPLRILLRLSPCDDSFSGVRCRLGERGASGFLRTPFSQPRQVLPRLDAIQWYYHCGFGDAVDSEDG